MHSENPRLLLSDYTIRCCRAAAAAPARGSHGMDRGHARRLLFPFLIRLFLLFVRRRDEPPPPSGPCCRHCLVRPRGFHAIPLACFVCLLAEAGAARRGRRCRDSRACTAGIRHAVLGCSPAKLAYGVSVACDAMARAASVSVAVGVGLERGKAPKRPGPNVRFLHGPHARGAPPNASTGRREQNPRDWPRQQAPAPAAADGRGTAQHGHSGRNVADTECQETAAGVRRA